MFCRCLLGKEGPTHPFSSNYYQSENWAVIDHILVRNCQPNDGSIMDFNLWKDFPIDEDGRITANFQRCGSDHFPLTASVNVSCQFCNL